jgi:hypothetical protein
LGYATGAAAAADTKAISLQYDHPVYYYDNGIKVLGAIAESTLVHKGSTAAASNETIYGTKSFNTANNAAIVEIGGAEAIKCSTAWADTTSSAVISKIIPASGHQS